MSKKFTVVGAKDTSADSSAVAVPKPHGDTIPANEVSIGKSKLPKSAVPLTISELMRHAEAVIRFENKSAVDAQSGLNDLVASSNDRTTKQDNDGQYPTTTEAFLGLESFVHEKSVVKIKSQDSKTDSPKKMPASELSSPNVVDFKSRKRGS